MLRLYCLYEIVFMVIKGITIHLSDCTSESGVNERM